MPERPEYELSARSVAERAEHFEGFRIKLQEAYMKRHLRNIVLTAGLSVLLGSSTLSAQDQKATADIRYAYHVREQTFSAVKYIIAHTPVTGVFVLRQNDTGHAIFMRVQAQGTGEKDAWKLTFGCYGGQCSLSRIWLAGDSYTLTARPNVRLAKNQTGVVAMVRFSYPNSENRSLLARYITNVDRGGRS
jgi:hypothetical protein